MIPVAPVPEQTDFDQKARVPGSAWLAAHPDTKRPRDLWSPFRPVLEEGFGRRCGYAAMLDPYEVQDGWFEILLPSLQMRATTAVPPPLRAKADYTLTRLKLRDGERVIRWRQSWYELYKNGQLTLEGLREVAPLIAAAVDRIITNGGNAP